jgi:hypothetical protein
MADIQAELRIPSRKYLNKKIRRQKIHTCMKTFNEWILEKHPELDEANLLHNLVTAATLSAASLGMMPSSFGGDQLPQKAQERQTVMQNDPAFQRDVRVFGKGKATERYNQRESLRKQRPTDKKTTDNKPTYQKKSVSSDDAKDFI